jgi:hypothetical protein
MDFPIPASQQHRPAVSGTRVGQHRGKFGLLTVATDDRRADISRWVHVLTQPHTAPVTSHLKRAIEPCETATASPSAVNSLSVIAGAPL